MSVSVSSPCCSLLAVRRLAGLLRWHYGENGEGRIMDEISVNMQVPPSPQWKTVYGHDGKVTYDLLWLQTHAINWHTFMDGDKVMLNYLSSYEMPLSGSINSKGVEERSVLTPEQEDAVRRIVAEEIKKVEKRLISLTVYELGQRMASMRQMRGEKDE